MAARKNSLINNINRRKKPGKSRPKARSTISHESYENMQKGWPKKKASKSASKHRKATKRRTAGRSSTASKSRPHAPKHRS